VPNRLAHESSPYLLQHADNPVDWYPWGEDAFRRAREEDKPILLSIGYSSCHWCHVMERESFEDEATAELMNSAFVSIKVDREERPDVDAVYMRAVQALTGHGGWPLTAFLTPAGVPFYGGTYFPPEPRHGMPAFRQVLHAIGMAYRDRKDEVASSAEQLREVLVRSSGGRAASQHGPEHGFETGVDEALLTHAARFLTTHFDASRGGFGGAPKFPQPAALELLLHHYVRTGERHALEMTVHTLRSMAHGGIRDHLAGGFHRYAVDARWLVPHFEKMLYDNALLLRAYVAAWQAGGDSSLLQPAREIAEWLLTDMRDPSGGFYSARDADSEGEEGRFYVWTRRELVDVLGESRARLFARVYDVSDAGNWEGTNVLNLPHDQDAVARAEGISAEEMERELAKARAELLEVRSHREPPFRDEKVVAAWNGLTLRALAEAGAVLGEEAWVEAARSGLDFMLSEMRAGDRLLRTWKDGKAKIGGFLEDYTALGNALLSLHEATLDPAWLESARWCVDRTLELFRDDVGVFYDTAKDAETLVIRPRDVMDNATPAGNSLAAELMLRAAAVFGEPALEEVAVRAIDSEAESARAYPLAFGRLLSVASRRLMTPIEVAVVGPRADPATMALSREALTPWLPQSALVGAEEGEALPLPIPLLESRPMRGGRPTAYVCSGFACKEPVNEVDGVREQLEELKGPGKGARLDLER
jgi:uncharacterized protein YyaL (SSP411 family)